MSKHKKLLIQFVGIAILVFYLICAIGFNVQADMGPKPSITLTIKNAPDNYYVALLDDWNQASKNPSLQFDNVNDDNIEKYLEDFGYEGWSYFQSPVGHNYFKKTEDEVYHFSYMVPNPFRVILVDSEGKVYVSDEIKKQEFNADVTYDVAAGTITEDIADKMQHRIVYIILCLVFTLVVEFIFLIIFRYPLSIRNIFCFIIINLLTNIPLSLIFLNGLASSAGAMVVIAWIVLEALITAGESVFYMFSLKSKDGNTHFLKNFLYGLIANVVSATLSVVVMFVFMAVVGL